MRVQHAKTEASPFGAGTRDRLGRRIARDQAGEAFRLEFSVRIQGKHPLCQGNSWAIFAIQIRIVKNLSLRIVMTSDSRHFSDRQVGTQWRMRERDTRAPAPQVCELCSARAQHKSKISNEAAPLQPIARPRRAIAPPARQGPCHPSRPVTHSFVEAPNGNHHGLDRPNASRVALQLRGGLASRVVSPSNWSHARSPGRGPTGPTSRWNRHDDCGRPGPESSRFVCTARCV
jgi:hypothetical protein